MLRSGRTRMNIAFGKQAVGLKKTQSDMKMATDRNATKPQRRGPFSITNLPAAEVEKKKPFVRQQNGCVQKSFKQTKDVEMPSESRDVEMVKARSDVTPVAVSRPVDKVKSSPKFCRNADSTDVDFAEYADDVYNYLKRMEHKTCLPDTFLNGDNDYTRLRRAILLDWVIQVQCHLHLHDETLHLAVTMTDRFLSLATVPLDKLQLLGVTCLLVASKIEERYPPDVEMLCFLTNNTYKKSAVLQMEMIILRTLAFDFCLPTPVQFYDLYTTSKAFDVSDESKAEMMKNLGKYILDLGICNKHVLAIPPSQRAAAALALATKILAGNNTTSSPAWTPALANTTGYVEAALLPCMEIYATLLAKAHRSKQQGARAKYSSISVYGGLSQLPLVTKSPVVRQLVMAGAQV